MVSVSGDVAPCECFRNTPRKGELMLSRALHRRVARVTAPFVLISAITVTAPESAFAANTCSTYQAVTGGGMVNGFVATFALPGSVVKGDFNSTGTTGYWTVELFQGTSTEYVYVDSLPNFTMQKSGYASLLYQC